MSKSNRGRGGVRVGAGRPPVGPLPVRRTVTLDDADWRWLDTLYPSESWSGALRRLIAELRERRPG